MAAKIFRINYKSDFVLTLNSDAGWMTPFCIKFWTGAPSQAFFAGWDGTTYTHCAYDPSEPTKLLVQFDDHHLPIGDLKFQIAYHFTVADFPNDTEDEVINPANITTEIDGETYQVMLDFTGETAPEIQFSLPAYANEAQRIANEQQRIANEQTRIENEQTRIQHEETREANESQRIRQEQGRVDAEESRTRQYAQDHQTAVNDHTRANNDHQRADEDHSRAESDHSTASDDHTTATNDHTRAGQDHQQATNDHTRAESDHSRAGEDHATATADHTRAGEDHQESVTQSAYAKDQGDYAKEQGDTALADHVRAESDHGIAVDDHTLAGNDHTRAESDHSTAAEDHTTAGNDHTRAESDHGIAVDDHTRAESDHGIAADDHTQAGNDHTRAESDHTRAESDHAAVEVYVDSLGAFDISAYHATGGVLAEYADLAAALGTNGANIPDALRKGGMSVKFVSSSDHKYVQYRYISTSIATVDFTNIINWQGEDISVSDGTIILKEWEVNTDYLIGNQRQYDGINYRCTENHTSTNTFDSSKWTSVTFTNKFPLIQSINIGTDENPIYQQNIKLAYFGIGQSLMANLAIGEYGYSTTAHLLYYKYSETKAYVIPFYDGAIYTYQNHLYVWNGSDLIKLYGEDLINLYSNKANKSEISGEKHSLIESDYISLTTGQQSNPSSTGAYPTEEYQSLLRGREIIGITLNISLIGTLTFVKGVGVGTITPSSFIYEIIETVNFTNLGVQTYYFSNPFVLKENEWLGLGITGLDSGKWWLNNAHGQDGGVPFYVPVSNSWNKLTAYDLQIALIGRDITAPTKLKGKKITIIGDSISTFSGTAPTSHYQEAYPLAGSGVELIEQTWWKRVIDHFGLTLEYNNSWQGSGVVTEAESSYAYRTERPATSDYRLNYIGNPDIVVIFIGTNDFGHRCRPLGEMAYAEGNSLDKGVFAQAYQYLLEKVQTLAPQAQIVCCTPLQRGDKVNYGYSTSFFAPNAETPPHYLYEFRDTIRELAKIYGCTICDLASCGITYWNSKDDLQSPMYLVDGLHPNSKGMKLIADKVIDALNNMY